MTTTKTPAAGNSGADEGLRGYDLFDIECTTLNIGIGTYGTNDVVSMSLTAAGRGPVESTQASNMRFTNAHAVRPCSHCGSFTQVRAVVRVVSAPALTCIWGAAYWTADWTHIGADWASGRGFGPQIGGGNRG